MVDDAFPFERVADALEHMGVGHLHGKIVDRVEREVISQVMRMCDSVQIKAAARLGINRNTLHKKLKEYGLDSGENGA